MVVVWRYVLAIVAYLIFVAAYLSVVSIGAVLVVVPPATAALYAGLFGAVCLVIAWWATRWER